MNDANSLLISALAILAAVLYLAAGARQLLQVERASDKPNQGVVVLGLLALTIHLGVEIIAGQAGTVTFGFYQVASLAFVTMSLVNLIILLFRPLHMLVIVIFPFSALAVMVSTFSPASGTPLAGLSHGVLIHVSLSLIAYAVISLATVQAVIVRVQSNRLRQHRTKDLIRILPPLQRMESMLYELITLGFILLTLAIASGAFFVDDLLGQKLVHKTVLTTIGWLILLVTVAVHVRQGWRINTAINLVLLAFGLLALGFFGSKLVSELLLGAA
ncbi:cytochrome c assembly protein [Luminiphilus syltensis NOR5-1B]|uniref:Cytochrome c assembly protein n=1 Tax=Luminiphilus syltensis NOR5-1B TaxID=565045 RepID=B8KXC8_9GAMM|nr:cytochrome c biogenesis protein CcsA [Luminiphilus syltensis]EED35088.1 cytochrome c assembly protein [Luminiphilus syltensis NOR5-1B]